MRPHWLLVLEPLFLPSNDIANSGSSNSIQFGSGFQSDASRLIWLNVKERVDPQLFQSLNHTKDTLNLKI